jgi:chaperonin GroEL
MGAKQLSYADDARQKLLAGASKLARAVRSTLGPRGRNAVLDKGWGSPTVTKDGVTVAEEVELTDPFENMGAQLVKEAASKTSDVAGDGTTTATVLAEHVFREGLRAVAAGHDPMALVRGIQTGVDKVVEELHKLAETIDPRDTKGITGVATISANNDKEIGQKLAGAMRKVGASGVITVGEGKAADGHGGRASVRIVRGRQADARSVRVGGGQSDRAGVDSGRRRATRLGGVRPAAPHPGEHQGKGFTSRPSPAAA